MSKKLEQFKSERKRLNDLVLGTDDLNIKRFFALDDAVYRDGALDKKTKELLGMVASLVLRCDDCVTYHIGQAKESGVTDGEFAETMSIGLLVGGSITIPHVRRAFDLWHDAMDDSKN